MYTVFIIFTIVVKVCFIILALVEKSYEWAGKKNSETAQNVVYWKKRADFVFIICMSLLLIYIFGPYAKAIIINEMNQSIVTGETKTVYEVDSEARLLLALYGFIMILTSDWQSFFGHPSLFS